MREAVKRDFPKKRDFPTLRSASSLSTRALCQHCDGIEKENKDRSRIGPINQAGVIPAIETGSEGNSHQKSLYSSLARSKYSLEALVSGDPENMTPLPISGIF